MTDSNDLPTSIGIATMHEDGTVELMLRSQSGQIIGHSLQRVKKTDKSYEPLIAHLRGITPGETVSVPPFPDDFDWGAPPPDEDDDGRIPGVPLV